MSEAPPELSETERIQAQIERMDALLALGKEALTKIDQFYQEHAIEPGIGVKTLLGDAVPEQHRVIFARILAEFPMIDQRIDEMEPRSPQPAPVPARTRAVGSRYRI